MSACCKRKPKQTASFCKSSEVAEAPRCKNRAWQATQASNFKTTKGTCFPCRSRSTISSTAKTYWYNGYQLRATTRCRNHLYTIYVMTQMIVWKAFAVFRQQVAGLRCALAANLSGPMPAPHKLPTVRAEFIFTKKRREKNKQTKQDTFLQSFDLQQTSGTGS